jgi:hypothetical protein
MPQEIRETHYWVGAATIPIDEKAAGPAHRRGTMRIRDAQTVTILELYCRACRRPYRDVRDKPCEIGLHLIGGRPDQSRAPRKPKGGLVMPDGTLDQRSAVGA